MTIVAARRYRDGKVVDAELPTDCPPPAKSEFDWVGVVEPTPEEMESLRVRYGLHPLAIEDALSQRQAPKAEAYGMQLFVIARTAAFDSGDKIAYGQTALFLGKDFLVTVRHGSERAHLRLRQQLEAVPERLAEGADFVLHAVLDFIVDGYAPLLDKLEETVSEMEEGVVARFPDQARIRRIFRLRRELRRFEDIAGRMVEVAAKLAELEQPCIDKGARPYFRDVLDNISTWLLARAPSTQASRKRVDLMLLALEKHEVRRVRRGRATEVFIQTSLVDVPPVEAPNPHTW